MGSVHEGSQLYEPIVRLSQSRVGEERKESRSEGYLPRLHSMSVPLHSLIVYSGVCVDRTALLSPATPMPLKLCLVQWKINFFIPIQNDSSKLAGAILRLIERQRNGQEIDQGLVKKVIDSFVSLGLDEDDISAVHLGVYREHFEIPFLRATEKYYKLKSETFLPENGISNYLEKAEEWLREEEGRVERCLNTETRKPLISSCVYILIRKHLELMYEASECFFAHDRDEDLRRVYRLLTRTPDDLELLRSKFEEHVKRAGLAAVSRLVGEGGTVMEVNPRIYVDALFEVHRKSTQKVNWYFEGEVGFAARLDKACREFANENAATGTPDVKSSELLVKYADALLRRGNNMAEEYLESALDRVARTFSHWLGVWHT